MPLAYLKLLIFLSTILIPVCDSFSLAFHLMYSACKLNKQGDNIQPWHIPFPSLNQYIIPCPVGMLGYSNSKVKCSLTVPGKFVNTTQGRFVWRKTYGVFRSNFPMYSVTAFLVDSVVKTPPANAGDVCSFPGSGRSPGDRNGHPPQCSCLRNPMDKGAWRATVHGVTKSWAQLSD